MLLESYLEDLAATALQDALSLDEKPAALLRPTQDPKFGDYQSNGVMPLAKKLGKNPRELAGPVAEKLVESEAIAKAEVAGPGFVNITLSTAWLAEVLAEDLGSETLGVPSVAKPETIVVDFSSPNIAKQMHVGHLRSTVIGMAVVKLLRAVGHEVIGDNHLGDWGTQFGLLIVGMREFGDEAALKENAIAELERVYKASSAKAKEDEEYAAAARAELAKLQSGDADNRALWQHFVETTRATLDRVYDRLDITFDEWLGESAYDEMLPSVCEKLLSAGIAREDQGALCVFTSELAKDDRFQAKIPKKLAKQKSPFIVRKGDGAFLYSTTDIATVLYRKEKFGADRSVYVVGQPQHLHFSQLFTVMDLLGIEMRMDHVAFGSVLGTDGKILRTRGGETIRLEMLLDEAEQKARERIEEGRESGILRIPDEDVEEAVKAIGIGAVKYVDLSQNRTSDYKFDLDKMVEFKGNAGPYLQYSYARARSIFAKGETDFESYRVDTISLGEDAEIALARRLARLGDVVHKAAESYQPHLLADHLYGVATDFNKFYAACPVLSSEGETRATRLALTALAGKQLRYGLGLLGIRTIERM